MIVWVAVLFFAIILSDSVFSQIVFGTSDEYNCGVSFTYDKSGNRISRHVCLSAYPSWAPSRGKDSAESVEQELCDNLVVYPNPTSALISISGSQEELSYEVLTADGKVHQSRSNVDGQIDLRNAPSGIYWLVLYFHNQSCKKQVHVY